MANINFVSDGQAFDLEHIARLVGVAFSSSKPLYLALIALVLLVAFSKLLHARWCYRQIQPLQCRKAVQAFVVPRKGSTWPAFCVDAVQKISSKRQPAVTLDDLIQSISLGEVELRSPFSHIPQLLNTGRLDLSRDISLLFIVGNSLVSQLITWRLKSLLPALAYPSVCVPPRASETLTSLGLYEML